MYTTGSFWLIISPGLCPGPAAGRSVCTAWGGCSRLFPVLEALPQSLPSTLSGNAPTQDTCSRVPGKLLGPGQLQALTYIGSKAVLTWCLFWFNAQCCHIELFFCERWIACFTMRSFLYFFGFFADVLVVSIVLFRFILGYPLWVVRPITLYIPSYIVSRFCFSQKHFQLAVCAFLASSS